jgi:DNA-binding NarL/FixJ family response regulator
MCWADCPLGNFLLSPYKPTTVETGTETDIRMPQPKVLGGANASLSGPVVELQPAGPVKSARPEVVSRKPESESVAKVFIADTSRMRCQLIAEALRRRHYRARVVGYATDSTEVRTRLAENPVHVLILSSQLKDSVTAGFNLARAVRTSHPETRVVMMLDSMEMPMVIEAFRAGAVGILSWEEPFEVMCKCIRAVHLGQVWANSKELLFALDVLAQNAPSQTVPEKESKVPSSLTNREETIVRLVTEGLTNREISRKLNLSEHTVRNYLFRIFNKVGTSSRLELALYALSHRREPSQ